MQNFPYFPKNVFLGRNLTWISLKTGFKVPYVSHFETILEPIAIIGQCGFSTAIVETIDGVFDVFGHCNRCTKVFETFGAREKVKNVSQKICFFFEKMKNRKRLMNAMTRLNGPEMSRDQSHA